MSIGEMIESLSERGSRADRLEELLDRYSAHGLRELTQEQVEEYYEEVFNCVTIHQKTNIGSIV